MCIVWPLQILNGPSHQRRNAIRLKARSSGTIFIDTTGPNYKSTFSLPSYELSLNIDNSRIDSQNLLMVTVKGSGRVYLKCQSLIARFSHNFMADSIIDGMTCGVSDSLSGMANLLQDFLDVGDVKIAKVSGTNSYETGGTLRFDLSIQSEEISIDLQKDVPKILWR